MLYNKHFNILSLLFVSSPPPPSKNYWHSNYLIYSSRMKERRKKIDQQLSQTSPEVQAQSNYMQCLWSQLKVLLPHAIPFWVISITGASFIYLVHHLIMESEFWTSWILMVIILVITIVTFTKKLVSVLRTQCYFYWHAWSRQLCCSLVASLPK